MVYKSELIKKGELKTGDVYKKELLNFYAKDYNCMLVIPNTPANIYIGNDMGNYRVKNIINNCCTIVEENYSIMERHYSSVIVIEKV